MKGIKFKAKHLLILCAVMLTAFGIPSFTHADASDYPTSISTNRANGLVTYAVNGLGAGQGTATGSSVAGNTDPVKTITLQVTSTTTKKIALSKDITLTPENCVNGTYTGTLSLSDINYAYDTYSLSFIIGKDTVTAGTADLSIHTDKIRMTVTGSKSSASRTMSLVSSESAGEVLIPGAGNQISVMAWYNTANENTAKTIGAKSDIIGNNGLTWPAVDVSRVGNQYGKWNAKLVLTNTNNADVNVNLAQATYSITPTLTSFVTKKTSTFEKNKSFGVYIYGVKNVYGVKKLSFRIYNSKGKKVATISGVSKNASGSQFYAAVTMKKLKYALGNYTVKAALTDMNGRTKVLSKTTTADQSLKPGTLSVTKKNAVCKYKLTNAYLPGYIKKVNFVLYKGTKKKESKVVKSTAGKKKISLSLPIEAMGKYTIKAYGYTAWGKRVLLNQQSYTLKKKDMGKNGWYYEKYNGVKYKVYYVNNVKQTDVTKVLKLKKSNATHTNNFYIEVNRAACTVTIYMKNSETGKYDIPVKTCTVCVGSDVSTVAGAGALNVKTYFTPIGTYSICSNGESVKYSLKTMYEPDNRILYARWATHIVGNVYFHAIAVGTQSHYALSSSKFNRLGSPASAGCIRMTVADAKWIYDYASTGSTVKIVKGNASKPGPLGKDATIKTNGVNYDPTDPDVPDSRKKADYKAKRISGYIKKNGTRVGY